MNHIHKLMARLANGQDENVSRNKEVINLCISVLFAEFVLKWRGEDATFHLNGEVICCHGVI